MQMRLFFPWLQKAWTICQIRFHDIFLELHLTNQAAFWSLATN